MNLLHLLPNFEYTSAGRQVSLIAPRLAGVNVQVAALGDEGPFSAPLRAAGIPVHALGAGLRWTIGAVWKLKQLIDGIQPDVVHCWRLPTLRAIRLACGIRKPRFRLVVSEVWRGGKISPIGKQWLHSADIALGYGQADRAKLAELGATPSAIREIPQAVPPTKRLPPPVELPKKSRTLMCLGSLTKRHGFAEAVWASDILHYLFRDLNIVLIGDGPERSRLAQVGRNFKPDCRHVHFLPARPDAASLLQHAEIVLVTSRSNCGRQVLLEAQSGGRPVVASAIPGIAEHIVDGESGLLWQLKNANSLVEQTRRLLDKRDLAARLGQAGRASSTRHTLERIVPLYADLYSQL